MFLLLGPLQEWLVKHICAGRRKNATQVSHRPPRQSWRSHNVDKRVWMALSIEFLSFAPSPTHTTTSKGREYGLSEWMNE